MRRIAAAALTAALGVLVADPAAARTTTREHAAPTAPTAQREQADRPRAVAQRPTRERSARSAPQRGRASYYHSRFNGRRMANGERFDPRSDSAAHRTLPLGTRARVTNLENGRSETVTIEDRGPFVRGRIVDVSPRTAERLGMRQSGVALVEVQPLGGGRGEGGEGGGTP